MIQLGILLVQNDKKRLSSRKIAMFEKQFETQCKVSIYRLKYSADDLLAMSDRKKQRIFQKAVRYIKKKGCITGVPDTILSGILNIPCEKERGIFSDFTYEELKCCVLKNWNEWGKEFLFHLAVVQKNFDGRAKELVSLFAPVVHSVKIQTNCVKDAEEFADKLCTEYGIFPEILRTDVVLQSSLLLIDLDRMVVHFGNQWSADGTESKLDVKEYQIDQHFFLKDILPEEMTLPRIAWAYGKKRLTRSF